MPPMLQTKNHLHNTSSSLATLNYRTLRCLDSVALHSNNTVILWQKHSNCQSHSQADLNLKRCDNHFNSKPRSCRKGKHAMTLQSNQYVAVLSSFMAPRSWVNSKIKEQSTRAKAINVMLWIQECCMACPVKFGHAIAVDVYWWSRSFSLRFADSEFPQLLDSCSQ